MSVVERLASAEHLALVEGQWVIHPASKTLPLRIEIPAGAHASVLEEGAGQPFEVIVGESAQVEWVRWQHEISSQQSPQQIQVATGAKVNWTGVQFGCQSLISPIHVKLMGQGAEAHLHGISFGQRSEKVENQICIEHIAPLTQSSQLFKSVLRDQAKSEFAGKIVIRKPAQKSDARQRHQSLNFHPTAQSITKPELEIEADDVKAAHGATVGRLNAEELFYLETRGIPRDEGMKLLARAFVQEVLGLISEPKVYSFIDRQLNERIGEFLRAMEVQ